VRARRTDKVSAFIVRLGASSRAELLVFEHRRSRAWHAMLRAAGGEGRVACAS
jgi:hypothetical protein